MSSNRIPQARPTRLAALLVDDEPVATERLLKLLARHEVTINEICWIEGMRNYSRVAFCNPERLIIFRNRLTDWQADLPETTFKRLSKSLLINMTHLAKSEWRSRDETLLSFAGRDDALTIGRLAAVRLREILSAAPGNDDDAPRG